MSADNSYFFNKLTELNFMNFLSFPEAKACIILFSHIKKNTFQSFDVYFLLIISQGLPNQPE